MVQSTAGYTASSTCSACLTTSAKGLNQAAFPSQDAAVSAAALSAALSEFGPKNCHPIDNQLLSLPICRLPPSCNICPPPKGGGLAKPPSGGNGPQSVAAGSGVVVNGQTITQGGSGNTILPPVIQYQTATVLTTVVLHGPATTLPSPPVSPHTLDSGVRGSSGSPKLPEMQSDGGQSLAIAPLIDDGLTPSPTVNSQGDGGQLPSGTPIYNSQGYGNQSPSGTPIVNSQGDGSQPQSGTPNGQSNGETVAVKSVLAPFASMKLPTPSGSTSDPNKPVIVGGQIVTPISNSGGVIINDQTITGGAVTLAGGIPVSVGPSGIIVVDGQTAIINPVTGNSPNPVTLGGSVITPIAGGSFIINGQTIIPGVQTILPNGQSISVGNDGTIIVNGETSVITPAPTTITPVPIALGSIMPDVIPIIFNGETITPFTSGTVILNGQILTPGQIVTLSDGHIISVGTSATVAIDGTSTSLPIIILATTTSGLKTASEFKLSSDTSSNSKSSSTSNTLPSPSQRSMGGAIASGTGASKKAHAATLHNTKHENIIKIGFGLIIGLLGLVIWL